MMTERRKDGKKRMSYILTWLNNGIHHFLMKHFIIYVHLIIVHIHNIKEQILFLVFFIILSSIFGGLIISLRLLTPFIIKLIFISQQRDENSIRINDIKLK